jgi:hypothetical protein
MTGKVAPGPARARLVGREPKAIWYTENQTDVLFLSTGNKSQIYGMRDGFIDLRHPI